MKKLALLLVLALMVSFASADEVNLDNLKAAHIAAMTYYGHAPIAAERNSKMAFIVAGKGMASVCFGENAGTAYMEQGERKIYWHVEKIEGGVIITIKVNIAGIVFEKSIKILFNTRELHIVDISKSVRGIDCKWFCLLANAAAYIGECGTDWKCYLAKCPDAYNKCCSE